MTLPVSQPRRRPHTLARLFALLLVGALLWCGWISWQIRSLGQQDQATPSDAIAVFGAAEYAGRPSPVLHARLDHAVDLYRHGIAPVIIPLGGGNERDSGRTEGGVSRDYLLARGIPMANIIAETRSSDTEEQVHRLAEIARDHHFSHVVVVSDATHVFRIRELCREAGLEVYTSPRPVVGHLGGVELVQRYLHEILSYSALRLGVHSA